MGNRYSGYAANERITWGRFRVLYREICAVAMFSRHRRSSSMLHVGVRSSKHTQASIRNKDHEADASEGPS